MSLPQLTDVTDQLKQTDPKTLRLLSDVSFIAGFASIAASVGIWATSRKDDQAHAERFGIFVGLWAPTFLILSNRLERYADASEKKPLN